MTDSNAATDGVPAWTLGWRMKRALAYAGMKAEDMADELGFERRTISRWVNEKGAPPRPVYLKAWALRTGVSYDWLIGQESGPDLRVGDDAREQRPPTFAAVFAHPTAA